MRSEVEVKYVTEQYLSKANTYMAIGAFLLFIPFYFIENWILIPFVIFRATCRSEKDLEL